MESANKCDACLYALCILYLYPPLFFDKTPPALLTEYSGFKKILWFTLYPCLGSSEGAKRELTL